MLSDKAKGYLIGALSAASYGINPIAIVMYNDGMNADSVLFYRYLLSAALVALLMLARKESFRLSLADLPLMFIMSMLFSFSSLGLFESYNYIDVSIASTLLFSYPAFVAIIMTVVYRESLGWIKGISIVLVGIGVVLLNQGNDGSADSLFGVALVLVSSLAYAIYIVSMQKSRLSRISSLKVCFYSTLFGNLLYVIRLHGCTELQAIPTVESGICAVALALFPTVISISALAKAVKYIGSTATAILGALEPVTAVFLGVIAFHERPDAWAITGMLIIMVAVTILVSGNKILHHLHLHAKR